MPGLLDLFDDPQANLAMAAGLLSGGNFGQALAKGLGAGQAYLTASDERKRRNEYMQAQAENLRNEIEARKAAMEKQAQLQRMMGNIWGAPSDAPKSPGAYAPAADGMGPVAPVPQSGGGLSGLTLDQVAQLKAAGGPDLLEAWKQANVGTPISAGGYVNRNGRDQYMPDPNKGLTLQNGQIVPMPGAEYIATLEGLKAQAQKQAENRNTLAPLDRVNPDTGQPYNATVDDLIQGTRGAMRPPAPAASEAGMRQQVSGPMGADPAALEREIKATQNSLMQPMDAASKAQLQQHLNELLATRQKVASAPQAGGFNGFAGPGDIVKLTEQAKADVQPTQQRQAALASAQYLDDLLTRAQKHPGRETATGLSGLIDPRNYIPGTDAKSYQAIHDQIGGNVFLQAYQTLKGGGQITEVEGKKAEAAIARMNRSQGDKDYLDALQEFQGIVRQGISRMKGGTSAPDQVASQKRITLADITETARKSGKTTAEVTAAFRSKGYEIGGQ